MSCVNPLSQYVAEAPLAAITALSLLGYVCISFVHLDLGISSILPFIFFVFFRPPTNYLSEQLIGT